MTDGPYRDGKIHVLVDMCQTCVFRPGNLMSLSPGRLKDLVDDNLKADAAIPCHSTIYRRDVRPAVCRGFFDKYETTPLTMAKYLGMIEEDPVPPADPHFPY